MAFAETGNSEGGTQSHAIAFTRDAPQQVKSEAFTLHFRCFWFLAGRRTWKQLLPGVPCGMLL